MIIYHNPRCRKSREALGLLVEKNVVVDVVEYLKTPLSKGELEELIQKLGIRPVELIRKSEEEYKLHFKGREMSDSDWIDAMLTYPKLMERPIVVKGDKAVVGRPPVAILDLI